MQTMLQVCFLFGTLPWSAHSFGSFVLKIMVLYRDAEMQRCAFGLLPVVGILGDKKRS